MGCDSALTDYGYFGWYLCTQSNYVGEIDGEGIEVSIIDSDKARL